MLELYMGEKYFIEIIEFTDPVCTWCRGSEPGSDKKLNR
jgi:hypothetical protein